VRSRNKEYDRIRSRICRAHKKGDIKAVMECRRILRTLPAMMTDDPNYRRLRYVRYADDCAPRRREGSGSGPAPERHAA
jgi:hypothetical protein